MLRWIFIIILLLVLGFMAFVRLAPTDPGFWNVSSSPQEPGDYPRQGGFAASREITTTPEGVLEAVNRIALATPRTKLIAGSVADGMMTYVTRSAFFGFPDYTTVEITSPVSGAGPLLHFNARQRFGVEDLGVNQARIEDWLSQLGPLIVAP